MDYGKRCKTNDRIPICQRIFRRTVIAAVIISVVLLIAWHAIVPSTSDAEKFGPMPTPEEACAEFAQGSEYDQVEFAGFVKSKDDTTDYEGDRLPAGWVGYEIRTRSQPNLNYAHTFDVYPCLYEQTSHEWNAVMVLTPATREPGWHYLSESELAKYHDRCYQ